MPQRFKTAPVLAFLFAWGQVFLLFISVPYMPAENWEAELLKAAAQGRKEEVMRLLQQGARVDAADTKGRTALMLAAGRGAAGTTSFLLEHQADPQLKDLQGHDALWYAQHSGDIGTITVVNLSRKLSARDKALLAAAEKGDLKEVLFLVQGGADLDIPNKDFMTPLILAASHGHVPVVKYLLNNHADIARVDIQKYNFLIHALLNDRNEVVKFLVEEKPEILKQLNLEQAIAHAAVRGNTEGIRMLLTRGKNLHLEEALQRSAEGGHPEIVKLLLEHHAAINAPDAYGWTPLSLAARQGHTATVKLLVAQGANLEQKSAGKTAINWAALDGHRETVALLKEKGAQVPPITYLDSALKLILLPVTGVSIVLAALVKWVVIDFSLTASHFHVDIWYALIIVFIPYLVTADFIAALLKFRLVKKIPYRSLKIALTAAMEPLIAIASLLGMLLLFDYCRHLQSPFAMKLLIFGLGAVFYLVVTAGINLGLLLRPEGKLLSDGGGLISIAAALGLGMISPSGTLVFLVLHYHTGIKLIFYWPMNTVAHWFVP